MYLSQLELVGFKSFAQKTALNFNDGITAIVGPNGCGKTNVVDAIRWVLGEQKSSTLRSDKMEDVIFNGTKSRKPLGLSEVSMTVENSKNILPTEYSQVTITRRLFRNGESQYLLNRVPCRLRDITDLFMDTGMGANAYSVIELKMIETILSSRTDDRRRLFEEAAGVTKYKLRKRETTSKLANVQDDLTRLNDIFLEVQKSVRSLSRQAEKARKFKDIDDQVSVLSQKILLVEYNNLLGQLAPLEVNISEILQERERISAEHSGLEREVKNLAATQQTAEQTLADVDAANSQSSRQIAENQQKIAVANERSSALKRSREQILREREDLERNLASLEKTIESIRGKHEALTEKIAEVAKESAAQKAIHDASLVRVQHIRPEVRIKKDDVFQKMNAISAIQAKAQRTIAQIESLNKRSAEISLSISVAEKRLAENEESHTKETLLRPEFDLAVATAEKSLHDAQTNQTELRHEIDGLQAELGVKQAEMSKKTAELEFLSGLVDTGESAAFLSKRENWQTSEKRVQLAESIATNEEFRAGIASALGEAAQFFIVPNADEAYSAMNSLRQKNKGKATFICLDRVPEVVAPSAIAVRDGVFCRASELVRAEQNILWAVRGLLGDTLIVENLAVAHECVDSGLASCAVSLDGEIVRRGGLVRGGAKKIAEGAMIGKSEQIASLKSEIEVMALEIRLLRELVATKTAEYGGIDLRKYSDAIRFAEAERNKHEQAVAQLAYRHDSLQNTLTGYRKELANSAENLQAVETQDDNALPEIERLQAEKKQAEDALEDSEKELRAAEQQLDNDSTAAHQAEMRLVQFHGEEKNLLAELQRLQQQVNSMKQRQSHREVEFERLEQDSATLREEIEMLGQIGAELKIQAQEFLEKKSIAQANATEIRERIRAEFEKIRVKGSELSTVVTRLHELELKISEIRGNIRHFVEEGREKYEILLDGIVPEEIIEVQEPIIETEFFDLVPNHTFDSPPYQCGVSEGRGGISEHSQNSEQIDVFEQKITHEPPKKRLWLTLPVVEDDFSLPTARDIAAKLKQQLVSFGAVNLLAFEEFEKENERMNFLQVQMKDLTDSEKTLLETMQEIDLTARRLFSETFVQIRDNFIMIFKNLFEQDDEADLLIADGTDFFDAQIDIIAKPRGKRPVSIEMLSGGEKTLTAIALLFAIYLVKPSPFCILDEVDAPLDDVNIGRYLKIIRQFSADTQFIMITHNKRTMEAADTLFGVTMEEEGISRVVSVKFDTEKFQNREN